MAKKILSDIEISSFCMEMAMLLKAGMPLEEGLLIMADEEKSLDGKAFLRGIYESVSEGMTFYNALIDSAGFPEYVTNMILIGEQTGNLEVVLRELNIYYESKEELSANLKSAVIYPFIMAIMMTVVLLVLALKVLPMFSQIYNELGSGIPSSVIIITQVGRVVSIALAIALGVILISAVVFMIYKKKNPNKNILSSKNSFVEKSKILSSLAKSRFASVMAMAFSSGIDMDHAMDLAETLVEYPFMQEKVRRAKLKLEQGQSFSDVMQEEGLFDGMNAGLVSTGFRSGSVDSAMKFVAKRYKYEAERKIEATVSVIEPALVITMSVFVGMILFIVMMPLLGIMSTIG